MSIQTYKPIATMITCREEDEEGMVMLGAYRALERENAALRHALQSIADEAVNHHETNLVSGITRLPRGYSEILNIAEAAIDAAGRPNRE